MKYFIYLIFILLLFGLNLGLFNSLQIRGQIPNLLFLMCLSFVLQKEDLDFFFMAGCCGLLLDFNSTTFFGGFTSGFLIVCFGLYVIVSSFLVFEINYKSLALVLIAALLVLNSWLWLYGTLAFRFYQHTDFSYFSEYMAGFLPSLFYNMLLFYPLFLLSRLIRSWAESFSPRRRSFIK